MERVVAFVEGYNDVRRMTDPEKMALPVYLVMAACRFWISRVQTAIRNHAENRVSEDVLEKDPDEMKRMVVARLRMV